MADHESSLDDDFEADTLLYADQPSVDELSGDTIGHAPISDEANAPLIRYIADLRADFLASLRELDLLIDAYRKSLEACQPRWDRALGLIWIRHYRRFGGSPFPVFAVWMIRKFGDTHAWFYRPIPIGKSRLKARRRGDFERGHARVQEILVRVRSLMERRQKLLGHLATLRRSVAALQYDLPAIREEIAALEAERPSLPFYRSK
ncbi:hypothetical protein BAE30_00060 [Acidithiobacillus caldus]|jgi:hypothetical protein|uniref:Uncharacterized protein n=1 Tax=Acidithiobacillus caldus TaxID=33059 RepID=A0A1E7Z4Q2_9PROT|nr:hypothetical protein BAE30_00060 [Acidithiobacillus caldus]